MERARREGKPLVATILLPEERLRIEAAGEGMYRTVHREREGNAIEMQELSEVAGVLVSVGHCERYGFSVVRSVVREVPHVVTVGILSGLTSRTPSVLLELGRYGVRKVIDIRVPNGWTELRNCVATSFVDATEIAVLNGAREAAPRASDEWWRFFEELVRRSRTIGSVRQMCAGIGVLPSTVMSRFFRAHLPAPKRYLAMVRLVRAGYLLENGGFSIANVANHLQYSSPQSFGRHVRTAMKLSAAEFRARYTGKTMLAEFVDTLVRPYAAALRTFSPMRVSGDRTGSVVSKCWAQRDR